MSATPATTTALQAERLRLFSFAAAPESARYLAILHAFDRSREAYDLVIAPEHLAERIEPRDAVPDDLIGYLDRLVDWGVLERSQDASRARTLAEYRRRHSRYQLTPMGHTAWTAIRQVLEADMVPAELRRLAFATLLDALRALAAAVEAGVADEVNRHLHTLDRELSDLAERSARFSVGFAAALRGAEATPELFLLFKERLLAHLDAFFGTLQAHLPALAAAVSRVEEVGVPRMLDLATAAEAAEALRDDAARRARWAESWAGVVMWFVRSGDGPSKAELLDRGATAGIRELLSLLGRVADARRQGISRAGQLESLAGWISALNDPTDVDDRAARALFQAVFGLRQARSLRTLHDDPATIETGTPWHQAPPEPITHATRQHARNVGPGRAAPVRDARLATERVRKQAAASREAAQAVGAHVLQALELGRPLTPGELALVLRLLGRALATGVSQRARSSQADGLLLRLDPDPHVTTLLHAAHGTVSLPGARVSITQARPR